MEVKIKKPKESKYVEDMYVTGEEETIENVIRFRSQQKRHWQLGEFLIESGYGNQIEKVRKEFVEIEVEGI